MPRAKNKAEIQTNHDKNVTIQRDLREPRVPDLWGSLRGMMSRFRLVIFAALSFGSSRASRVSVKRKPPSESRLKLRQQRREDPTPLPSNYSSVAEYCIDVVVGGKQFCLDLDTGSSDTGIIAAGCDGCWNNTDAPYAPKESSTAVPEGCSWCDDHESDDTQLNCSVSYYDTETCNYYISYADESGFNAAIVEDDFSFVEVNEQGGASATFKATVGAIYHSEDWSDDASIDGIVGFAGLGVSSTGASSPFTSGVASGAIDADVFSLCLRDTYGTAYLGTQPGVTNASGTTWTQRVNTSDYFAVGLSDVLLGGVSVGVEPSVYTNGEAIVDSGSTDTCFSNTAFKAVKHAFFDLCGSEDTCLPGVCNCNKLTKKSANLFNSCVDMSPEDLAAFPDITLVFADGAQVVHTAPFYVRNDEWSCDGGMYSMAIESCGDDGSGTILGASFMGEFIVVHDNQQEENRRIGFLGARTDCP